MKIQRPEFEKTANYKMGKDSTGWKEEIIKNFIDSVGSKVTDNMQFDIEMGTLDDNTGYGVGSIVAWSGNRKINFPIVIKDYEMFPVDVFVVRQGGDRVYYHATEKNISKALSGEELFNGEKKDYNNTTLIKRPGGVELPVPVVIDRNGTGLRSMPGQFGKYAEDMSIIRNFERNSGSAFFDAMAKFAQEETVVIKADLSGTIQAQKSVTMFETDVFDKDDLDALIAPCACEIRIAKNLSLEDFSARNVDGTDLAKSIGTPIQGVLLNTGVEGEYQFISPGGVVINYVTSPYGFIFDQAMFGPMLNLVKEKLGTPKYTNVFDEYSNRINAVIINKGVAETLYNVRRVINNGKDIIVSNDGTVYIPANVGSIIDIEKVEDKIVKNLGQSFRLYPETASVAYVDREDSFYSRDILRPDSEVLSDIESLKTMISVGDGGFSIRGVPASEIASIVDLDNLTPSAFKNAMKLLGADTSLVKRACDEMAKKGSCTIYGLRSPSFQKVAGAYDDIDTYYRVMTKTAEFVKRDLTKEASELNDPESVDKVLSLNMVTKDNVASIIQDVDSYKKILSNIAELLILSRVGASSINENALKKVMENLTEVVNGIEIVRTSLGL